MRIPMDRLRGGAASGRSPMFRPMPAAIGLDVHADLFESELDEVVKL